MYRYQFTSTVEDLLEAEEAERSNLLRRPFRAVIIVLGLAWLAAGLAMIAKQRTLQPLVWTCLGVSVVYYFLITPHRRRRRIKTNNATNQDVTLEFTDGGLSFEIRGVGEFTRQWSELAGLMDAKKGILFSFTDGIKNWLPNRVFESGAERQSFLRFIDGHQSAQEEPPRDVGRTEA
jgi:hypothetical protein